MKLALPDKSPGYYTERVRFGIEGIEVELLDAPNPHSAADTVFAFADATFNGITDTNYDLWTNDEPEWMTAQQAMVGAAVVPTALEAVALTFGVQGVTRTFTHQLTRSRVGAGFGQHSMRATPADRFNLRLPATFQELVPDAAMKAYENALPHLRRFYSALLEAGVPYQDARFVLPEAVETHVVATYNLLALKGVIQRRVCNRMAWEINAVVRHMHDLTVRALPWVGRSLRSRCEQTGVCQTLDPMFEASCYYFDKGTHSARLCADAKHLEGAEFKWPRSHNGNALHWFEVDVNRLFAEAMNPDEVISMVDGVTVLARQDDQGLWRKP